MNKKLHHIKSFLVIGMIFFSSCSPFYPQASREVASSPKLPIELTKGLYPEDLRSKNVFELSSNAKVVFNLPPYTNPGNIGILPEMLNVIDSAKNSIRMSVFQFNHIDVFNALKKAASRGVKIYITTDLCYSGKAGYKEYFDDLKSHLNTVGQNADAQVIDDKTASCETMFNHNKYMIVDVENPSITKAWFGSFNPTNHGSVENVELAIVARDESLAKVLKLDFDQQLAGKFKVYKKGVYSVIENGKSSIQALSDEEIKALLKKNIQVTYPKIKIGDVEFEMLLSPKVKSLSRIIEEVYNAKKEILFSSFAIADQMLISSIINKSKTTGTNYNLFSVLTLPHPSDDSNLLLVKNGNPKTFDVVDNKSKLSPIVEEIKNNMATPSNFLTPKGELKSTFKYIYPKGENGGVINKVTVEGIFNSKVIDEKNTYQRLLDAKIPVFKSSLYGELHNKLFLIDENVTIFGSHNFSQSAENSNDELTVIIKSNRLTKLLKDELYLKTKAFSVAAMNPMPSYSANASLVITEVMADSLFKMNWNKKTADIGDYVEIYNYGNNPINLLGFRIDDHFFPKENGETMDLSTNSGFVGTLVRFIPNKELNKLGTVDYTQENNILPPKKVALIVGKYFNESYYLKAFEENFQKLYGKKPTKDQYPILFTSGEYYSAVLGDSGTGLSTRDRLTLYGIDSMTVIDRFMFPQVTKAGTSLERRINEDELNKAYNQLSYDLVSKDYFFKNGTKLVDYVFMPDRELGSESEWKVSESGGTPGIIPSIKREIAAENSLYTIEAEVVDVFNNKFVKGLVVIENGKFKDIVSVNDKKYPAPIIRDVLIFPGLVDGHNHIKYNTMPIWKTTKTYENRNQWPEESVYKNGIKELYKEVYMNWPECTSTNESEQNACLAKNRCLILKYAELKALMGGTTSIQGSSSFDESSSDITFKGLTGYTIGSGNKISKSKARIVEDMLDQCSNDYARNIERETWRGKDVVRTTAQSITSDAFARKNISDNEKFKTTPSFKLLEEFKNRITDKFFLHLGEGKDQSSKAEWDELTYLKLNVPQVTIIHGTALDAYQLKKMGEVGESLLWSPTSNLLLYKQTTNVLEALKNKVNVALGSDWSLSGTKSLLYELKVANQANKKYFNGAISKNELLKMVTINGAIASGVSDLIGSIEKNKYADFFIVSKKFQKENPFDTLLSLKEEQIESVVVGGVPLVGNASFLSKVADSNFTETNDSSCFKDKVINMDKVFYDQMIAILKSKTENGFKNLSLKFQNGLGVDFSRIDPLCSDNDSRYLDIINGL